MARGHSNDYVAQKSDIAQSTVKTHGSRILDKLNLITRVHAVDVTTKGDSYDQDTTERPLHQAPVLSNLRRCPR